MEEHEENLLLSGLQRIILLKKYLGLFIEKQLRSVTFFNNLLYNLVGSPMGFIRLEGNTWKELRKKKTAELLNSYSADLAVPLFRASSSTPSE